MALILSLLCAVQAHSLYLCQMLYKESERKEPIKKCLYHTILRHWLLMLSKVNTHRHTYIFVHNNSWTKAISRNQELDSLRHVHGLIKSVH